MIVYSKCSLNENKSREANPPPPFHGAQDAGGGEGGPENGPKGLVGIYDGCWLVVRELCCLHVVFTRLFVTLIVLLYIYKGNDLNI